MSTLLTALLLSVVSAPDAKDPGSPIVIGGRRELLVDDFLVERLSGGARFELHRPVPREIVLKTDAPWEGNACGYQSVFQDGKLYRMYYHGGHYRHGGKPAQTRPEHPWVLCYAESDDGVRWRRPELGLLEFGGSKKNNIILTPESVAAIKGDPAHTAVFKDANPNCPADARYKCVIVGKPHGLYLLKSADGIRFSVASDRPAITQGAFDSQNLVFWDPIRNEYRAYWRIFTAGVADGTTWKPAGIRAIRTATSKDLVTWTGPADLRYVDSPPQQLYTNQIQPYYRAPHIFMGFPMRYTERGWPDAMMALPGLEERLARAKAHPRYGMAITDGLFMTSRDGVLFHRWNEALVRPGSRRQGSWVYGDNMVFWGMVETASALGDAPNELSIYSSEDYWQGTGVSFRRLSLRIDGFVSLWAPFRGGEMVTKPLMFEGGNLSLNASTSGAGSIQVEIQDAAGQPVPGYALADCPEIFGDDLAHIVRWRKGGDVRPLAGKPVRLRFVFKDADLYSFQLVPYQADPVRPRLSTAAPVKARLVATTARQTGVSPERTSEKLKAGQPVSIVCLGDSVTGIAKKVRTAHADLVLVAVPEAVTPGVQAPPEHAIRAYSWILNWSLSFGQQQWDVVGIAPSVLHAGTASDKEGRDEFARRRILAQDLSVVARPDSDRSPPEGILRNWLCGQLSLKRSDR